MYKCTSKIFLTFILSYFLFSSSVSIATPEYILRATNITKTASNAVEFDIMLLHSNPDSSTFEYAGGQYFFDFNLNIGNGGILTYSIVNSDLPSSLQPKNPMVYVMGGEMQLRLSLNLIPPPGNGYIISSTGSGTKIVRMKLETDQPYFNTQYFHLRWRNGPANPYTKIFAYVGSDLTEITDPANHFVDSLQTPLPVELAGFVSSVSQNNVTLDWATYTETNNFGFSIERKSNDVWQKIGFVNGSGNSVSPRNYRFRDEGLNKGTYNYRIKQTDFNGEYQYFVLGNEVDIISPEHFSLMQNYPNPFNSSTVISYNLPYDCSVKIILYDVSGKQTAVIRDGFLSSGFYRTMFNAGKISSGIYFYKLTAVSPSGSFSEVRRLNIIK